LGFPSPPTAERRAWITLPFPLLRRPTAGGCLGGVFPRFGCPCHPRLFLLELSLLFLAPRPPDNDIFLQGTGGSRARIWQPDCKPVAVCVGPPVMFFGQTLIFSSASSTGQVYRTCPSPTLKLSAGNTRSMPIILPFVKNGSPRPVIHRLSIDRH